MGPPPVVKNSNSGSPERTIGIHFVIRWIFAILTVATTGIVVYIYFNVLRVNGLNPVELMLLPVFIMLFVWIAFSFWTSTWGLIETFIVPKQQLLTELAKTDPNAKPMSRTAILMPIYNESPCSVFAGMEAMLESILLTGNASTFDMFILSDTTDPDVWLEEERTWAKLVSKLDSRYSRVFYRRRPKNLHRKSGNIADFCSRWGANYEHMIVLDADSVMEGKTLVEMVRRMDADPQLGILQVPPTPVNQLSLFARLQQFSSRLYGPIFIRGFKSWAHFDSNYWGHNAIIRVEPFIRNCGLPLLPGNGPLGGEILSHDFVEAAMMARAGWKVGLADDLSGSYEECPTTLVDYAKRDQRWCQGNMQHIRLIFSEGFQSVSRLHMTMGVMSYLSSPIWILFMLMSIIGMLIDTGSTATNNSNAWKNGAFFVFCVSMTLLLVPKFWGLLSLANDPVKLKEFGGWAKVTGSVLIEILFSILMAPLMMFFHTRFVIATLLGEKVVWSAQNRNAGNFDYGEAFSIFGPHMLSGILSGLVLAFIAPNLLPWFSPILVGLVISVPLAMILASVPFGEYLARKGFLLIPEETATPEILKLQQAAGERYEREAALLDRTSLFNSVLTDPSFHALHRNILQATDSQRFVTKEELTEIVNLIQRDGPQALSREARKKILSDPDALREIHIQIRSRMRFRNSFLWT
jgi:membrane glycosyltransferase